MSSGRNLTLSPLLLIWNFDDSFDYTLLVDEELFGFRKLLYWDFSLLILKWVSLKSFSTVSKPWKLSLFVYLASSNLLIPFCRLWRLIMAWARSYSDSDPALRLDLAELLLSEETWCGFTAIGKPAAVILSLGRTLSSWGDWLSVFAEELDDVSTRPPIWN